MADIGYNLRYAIETGVGTGVYTELFEVYDCKPPEFAIGQEDVTHYQSPNRTKEYIPKLTDPGTAMAAMNFYAGSVTDLRINALRVAGTVLRHRITFPNGYTFTFPASVSAYVRTPPLDGKQSAEMTVQVSGSVVEAAGAIAANTVLPAISGLATNGSVLTAFPGVWSQSATYTYQWSGNNVDISGATGPTYTLQAGQVGQLVRVKVTATNAIGSSAVATSLATPAVV